MKVDNHFESAFEYSGIGMALVSPEGKWLRVNASLLQIVGYTEEELLEKTFQDITYPDDLDVDLHQVQQMLAKEISSYQMKKRYFHKDGHIVWVNLTVSLVWKEDGTPDFFISQIEDITKQVEIEENLREKEKQLQQILDAMVSGLYIYDVQKKTHKYINKQYTSFTGWSLEELQNMGETFLELIHPDDQNMLSTHIQEVSSGIEGGVYEFEYRFKHKNGSWLWLLSFDAPFERGKTGEVLSFIGSFVDITDKKNEEKRKVQEMTKMSHMNKVMVGRETKMIDLKKEIDDLLEELGRPKKYS